MTRNVIFLLLLSCFGSGASLAFPAPQDAEAGIAKGRQALQRGDYSGAERVFLALVKQRSNDAEVYYWLGVTYMQQERNAEAEKSLRKAAELRADYPAAYNALGALYDRQERYREAEAGGVRGGSSYRGGEKP